MKLSRTVSKLWTGHECSKADGRTDTQKFGGYNIIQKVAGHKKNGYPASRFWFKVRGGHRIMRQHFCGSPYTFQQAHHIFKTGRFKFSSEAAVCLDTNKAREYVIKRI